MSESDSTYRSDNVFSNVLWKLLERGSAVAVSFVVQIVLARLLAPSVHGLLAMVTVFVNLSQIFITAGLGNALIQEKDTDELDFSTIFWMNLLVAIILYALLFIAAPYIASYYGYAELSLILRVLSLNLIIQSVNSIQCAYISRKMMFRHYFYSTLSGKVASGIIGITMAYLGAGVWARVAQTIALPLVETIVLWFRVKWRPALRFSWERGKRLYAFAYRVMFTSFVRTIADQLRNLLIGKSYSSADLAFYNKGSYFPNSITTNVSTALAAVMFPVLSKRQGDLLLVKSGCRRWISIFAYCMFPILTCLAVTAETWVPLVLSSKWIPIIPYVIIACGIYASWIVEVPIKETLK